MSCPYEVVPVRIDAIPVRAEDCVYPEAGDIRPGSMPNVLRSCTCPYEDIDAVEGAKRFMDLCRGVQVVRLSSVRSDMVDSARVEEL